MSRPSPGARPAAGLCDACRHQQIVRNTRGSVFSLCRRSRTSPSASRATRGCRSRAARATSRGLLRRKRIQDDEVAAVLGLLELLGEQRRGP